MRPTDVCFLCKLLLRHTTYFSHRSNNNTKLNKPISGFKATEICLKESENDPVWFNGIVRSEETVILLNLGGTSAGLDIHLYPKQDMDGGTVTLAQGVGGQKATFPNAMYAGDDVALLASTRECTRNGRKETKYGFFQYSAAWDSKHIVSLPQGKSAQLFIFHAGNGRWRTFCMEV